MKHKREHWLQRHPKIVLGTAFSFTLFAGMGIGMTTHAYSEPGKVAASSVVPKTVYKVIDAPQSCDQAIALYQEYSKQVSDEHYAFSQAFTQAANDMDISKLENSLIKAMDKFQNWFHPNVGPLQDAVLKCRARE